MRECRANWRKNSTMRYDQVTDLVRLAVRLQRTPGGLTLDDIQADFSVSRSTAERMRNAVEAAFDPLKLVDTDDPKRHWRLRSDAVRRLVAITPEELAELESAASALERVGLEERAGTLRELSIKLRAVLRPESRERLESDFEALMLAEGLAMRAGPRPRLDAGLLSALREAITMCRLVEFRYLAQSTGLESHQRVAPPRTPLRKPRVPRRVERLGEGAAALARRQRERASHQRRDLRARPGLRPRALRETFVRNLPGGARRGLPPVRPRRRPGRLDLRLPPEPDDRAQRRRLAHGPIQGGRHQRNVLAPLHLGRQRHD